MNVTAAIPDDLAFHTGDEVQLQALVQADGTFLVTRVLRQSAAQSQPAGRMTLGDWIRKWGGAFKLPEGASIDDIRRSALRKKHGL